MSKPKIVEGEGVYIIEPFPLKDAHRIYSWMKAFKTIIQTDESPKNKNEFIEQFKIASPNIRSFGVIDKNNKVSKEGLTLVGAIIFEPNGKFNGFIHAASRTSAFGSHLMDEAGEIVIEELFDSMPELVRVSAMVHYKNNMAASLAKRVGFVKEGKLEDYIVQKGQPKAVFTFGLTRRRWNKFKETGLWDSSQQQPQLSEGSSEVPSEGQENKADSSNDKQDKLPGLPLEQSVELAEVL